MQIILVENWVFVDFTIASVYVHWTIQNRYLSLVVSLDNLLKLILKILTFENCILLKFALISLCIIFILEKGKTIGIIRYTQICPFSKNKFSLYEA